MVPEPRLAERLAVQLRRAPTPGAFVAAGDALALALLEEGGDVAPWTGALADAMLGALLHVKEQTLDVADAPERVRLATAAIVLSAVRPHAARACDVAAGTWLGWGVGRPRGSATVLAAWTLLLLHLDDPDGAADAAHELRSCPDGAGMVLHDWVVARVQLHGPQREAQCFEHLCRATRGGWGGEPALVVLAAVASAPRLASRGTVRERLLAARRAMTPHFAERRAWS